jgi:hypothetical protein
MGPALVNGHSLGLLPSYAVISTSSGALHPSRAALQRLCEIGVAASCPGARVLLLRQLPGICCREIAHAPLGTAAGVPHTGPPSKSHIQHAIRVQKLRRDYSRELESRDPQGGPAAEGLTCLCLLKAWRYSS